MSSTYRPICLNHDPALIVDHEWSGLDSGLAAVVDPRDGSPLAEHVGCDLVIGRWSGALIEFTCPPTSLTVASPHGRHNVPKTIGVEWLRLLCAAEAYPDLAEPIAKVRRIHFCWHPGRLARLARLLDTETWA